MHIGHVALIIPLALDAENQRQSQDYVVACMLHMSAGRGSYFKMRVSMKLAKFLVQAKAWSTRQTTGKKVEEAPIKREPGELMHTKRPVMQYGLLDMHRSKETQHHRFQATVDSGLYKNLHFGWFPCYPPPPSGI